MHFVFGDHVLDPARRELRRGAELIEVEPQCSTCCCISFEIGIGWSRRCANFWMRIEDPQRPHAPLHRPNAQPRRHRSSVGTCRDPTDASARIVKPEIH